MTAGTNGLPDEQDDPFAYLYRPEGEAREASGPGAASQPAPGTPRTSYTQATQVGRRPAGQPQPYAAQPQQAPYPQAQYSQQAQAQAQPPQQQQYAPYAPEQPPPPGGRAARRAEGSGGGPGGSHRGLALAAVGVVVAIAAGVVFALLPNNDDKGGGTPKASSSSPAASKRTQSQESEPSPTKKAKGLKTQTADSTDLQLTGGASFADNHKGANSKDGKFVVGMETPGATITWNVKVPKTKGLLYFTVRYANGGDGDKATKANATVYVNGKPQTSKMRLIVWPGSKPSWDQWMTTWTNVTLNPGSNTIQLKCDPGDVCSYNVDQFTLSKNKQ